MVGIVGVNSDTRNGRTYRLNLLSHVRRHIVLGVDGLHSVKSVQLSVPTAYEHVISCFGLNIDREFYRLCSRSCWSVVQSNPRWGGIEIQPIACHPNAVAAIEARNGHRRVGVTHLQTTGNIG